MSSDYDVIIVGGGPAGATAARDLAASGQDVLMIERGGRIKPCGGAIPPIAMREFDIPESQLECKVTGARMIAPSDTSVDMEIGGFVGMVDRKTFDPWLRKRAEQAGASCVRGKFRSLKQRDDGCVDVHYVDREGTEMTSTARLILGADGAGSQVREQAFAHQEKMKHVFAYHEIVESPEHQTDFFDPERCDVYYQGRISPDFYGWVFPHGKCTSVGVGSAVKGFSLRAAVKQMRDETGLDDSSIVRREGAPLPLKPLKRWDNGKNVVLVGDAAGCVAPSSGEGIYYAMSCGRMAANAAIEFLETSDVRALKQVRREFMKAHRTVFFILGVMQYWWYSSDKRREKFVDICRDPDVQKLTWDAYMNKQLVRAKPAAHVRIFFKDLAHLVGLHPS
ncbi:MAG: geranylgeranyl diphosphate reductase [Pseudomonadota bacterium]